MRNINLETSSHFPEGLSDHYTNNWRDQYRRMLKDQPYGKVIDALQELGLTIPEFKDSDEQMRGLKKYLKERGSLLS